jgi:hypothetical protein
MDPPVDRTKFTWSFSVLSQTNNVKGLLLNIFIIIVGIPENLRAEKYFHYVYAKLITFVIFKSSWIVWLWSCNILHLSVLDVLRCIKWKFKMKYCFDWIINFCLKQTSDLKVTYWWIIGIVCQQTIGWNKISILHSY